MTDYSKTQSYTPKDALATGDPEKLILGSDFDAELDLIVTAIGTKYDSTDIATQAQAEAGTNNVTIMTPLRVAQILGGAYGGSGAGIVLDLLGLADPNADRILFWDDSAGAAAFLAPSTGLTITGTNITTNDSQIVHNSLSGYDANRHIDHTAVTLTPSGGITLDGATSAVTIAASRTIALSISGLTADSSPDLAADYLITYDASATANKKVLASTLVGNPLGDGKWYLNGAQSLSAATEATVVFNAADYDSLQRGTYSTSTGIYTAGASGARVLAIATCTVTALNAGATFELMFHLNGVEKTRGIKRNNADSAAEEAYVTISAVFTLAASDTLKVRAETSSAESMTTAISYNSFSIVELA